MEVNTAKELHTGLKEDKDIELTSDINFSHMLFDFIPFYGKKYKWSRIKEYNGVLDGNGYELQDFIRINTSFVFKLNGEIKNLCINNTFYSQCDVGKLCEVNDGKIVNCTIESDFQVTLDNVCRRSYDGTERTSGVICHYNNGLIEDCDISNTEVNSWGCSGKCKDNYNKVGGICIFNDGTIQECTVGDSKLAGEKYSSGICDENTGVISECDVYDTIVDGEESANGICRENDGEISGCKIHNTEFTSEVNSSGISSSNTGVISNSTVSDSKMKGKEYSVGISRYNFKTIRKCTVKGCNLESKKASGLVAVNSHSIYESKVSKTELKAGGTFYGLCIYNEGTLTQSELSNSTLISTDENNMNNGGLVGENPGEVSNCVLVDIDTNYKHNLKLLAISNSGTIKQCIIDTDEIVPDIVVDGDGKVESCMVVSDFDSKGFRGGISTAQSLDKAKTLAFL